MLQEQNGNLQAQLEKAQSIESLVGTSARMREVMEQVQQVGPTDATVPLLGKAERARRRWRGRFISNHDGEMDRFVKCTLCGAAFDAAGKRAVWSRARRVYRRGGAAAWAHRKTDRGTLFLDEIGEIPPAVQVKMLRFIQDRTFHRVGSSQARSVDLQNHLCIESQLASSGERRQPARRFYYRINVFPIHLPALRRRSDDIPKLVQDILRRRHPSVTVSQPALDLLQRYPLAGQRARAGKCDRTCGDLGRHRSAPW